jgi:hypothetical protein
MFKYVKEEDIKSDQFEKLQKMKVKKDKIEKKENGDNENENEKKEEEKRNKSIEITTNLIRLISNRANSFLDKNDIDQAVFEYYKSNDDFGKLFALMFVMDELGILTHFSKYFSDRMDEFKEKKYIFDINGTVHDYSTEESQMRLREYVKNSEIKYYSLIEGAYNYCINLKSIKIDDKRDNNRIIEDYVNEDSDEGEIEEVKGNKEKKSRVGIDEISEEEIKNEDEKEEEDEIGEEGDDDVNEDEEQEESKNQNQKKKVKNKINSKKKKADELKPKYKKSQTYKNKKDKNK